MRFVIQTPDLVIDPTREVIFSQRDIPVRRVRPDPLGLTTGMDVLLGERVLIELDGQYLRWSVSPYVPPGAVYVLTIPDWGPPGPHEEPS